jgi:hypothetical protein
MLSGRKACGPTAGVSAAEHKKGSRKMKNSIKINRFDDNARPPYFPAETVFSRDVLYFSCTG